MFDGLITVTITIAMATAAGAASSVIIPISSTFARNILNYNISIFVINFGRSLTACLELEGLGLLGAWCTSIFFIVS